MQAELIGWDVPCYMLFVGLSSLEVRRPTIVFLGGALAARVHQFSPGRASSARCDRRQDPSQHVTPTPDTPEHEAPARNNEPPAKRVRTSNEACIDLCGSDDEARAVAMYS